MTEREKRLGLLTGSLKKYTNAQDLAHGCKCIGIEKVELSEDISQEDEMKIDSIKEKISIIKSSEEAENEYCEYTIRDDTYDDLTFKTKLKNALLSSVSLGNGKIIIDLHFI